MWRWFLALILLVAAGLRLYHLGQASFNVDEAFSLWLAGRDLAGMLEPLRADSLPAGFYLLLKLLLPWKDSEAAVRLVSVLPGLGLVLLAGLWGARYASPRVGLAAAGMAALSSWMIYRDQEARPYPLMALAAWLALTFFLEAVRSGRRPWWALYALATALAFHLHYNTALLLPVPWLWLALQGRRAEWRPLALAQAGALALALPWLPVLAAQLAHGGGSSVLLRDSLYAQSFPGYLADFFAYFGLGAQVPLAQPLHRLAGGLFAAGAAGGWRLLRRRSPGFADLLTLCLAVPVAEAALAHYGLGRGLFSPRHAHFLGFPFYLLLAGLVRRPGVALALGAVFVAGNLASWQVFTHDPLYQNPPWREVAALVEREGRPGDAVAVFIPYHSFAYRHYDRAGFPLYQVEPGNLAGAVEYFSRKHGRLWLVLIHERLGDPEGRIRQAFEAAFPTLLTRVYPNAAPFDRITLVLYRTEASPGAGGPGRSSPRRGPR